MATSVDLSRAVALVAIYLAWRLAGPDMAQGLAHLTEGWLRAAATTELTPEVVVAWYEQALPLLAGVLAPVMLAAVIGTVLAAVAQTRGLLAPVALNADFSRINPATGARRLVSWRGAVGGLKGVIKVALVLLIAAWVLRSRAGEIAAMSAMELGPMLALLLGTAADLTVRCLVTLLVLGAADYVFEWWDHEKSLRMTRHELHRDLREEEGDPQIRGRRRRLRRSVLAQGISAELPQANVVVTNPIHYAVALRYDPRRMPAPKVVARGQRAIARRIVRLARLHGVPVIHNPPVARALFTACSLGDHIPQQLFQVVAEIFAAVYRKRRERARRDQRAPARGKGEPA